MYYNRPYDALLLARSHYISNTYCASYRGSVYYFILHNYGQKYATLFYAGEL